MHKSSTRLTLEELKRAGRRLPAKERKELAEFLAGTRNGRGKRLTPANGNGYNHVMRTPTLAPKPAGKIGQIVRTRRTALKMSQTELARRSGVCFASINRLEQGIRLLTNLQRASIARVLSLDPILLDVQMDDFLAAV